MMLFTLVTGCTLTREDSESRLNTALAALTPKEVHSAVMWVDAPRHGIQRGFAHGLANVALKQPMTVETPFFSASVGKLFVAAAILQLVSEGRLSLSAPVTDYIPRAELAGLPIKGGDSAFEKISVAMLLAHRTGLPDYFSDVSRDGSPRLFDRILTEPHRKWSRRDCLDYARAHYSPAEGPQGGFHYSDTNYDLLGLVLESVTKKPFHQVVRDRVINPLGLKHTWYHAFESAPSGATAPADIWINGTNLRGALSVSVDQAGGGLITTVHDLRDFMRALVSGRPVPLSQLETDFTENAVHAGIDVGRGAWRIRPGGVFFALAALPTLVGHSGATGVWAYYASEWDAVLVGAVSDSSWQEKHAEFLLRDILPILARTSTRPLAVHK
ncbi:MAG: hypothetical protein RJB38_1356 [Pseudomonadota bacterium]|jgi:CubicO group peptidase (beta-lactamase class C family)